MYFRNYEFIIVENNSTEEKTFQYYKALEESCPRAKVLYWEQEGFNYPAINNFGVEHAKNEITFNGEVIATFEGEVKGVIAKQPSGNGGFGYDPVFIPNNFDKSFGDLPQEVKNQISHRANAFKKALEFVEDELAAVGEAFDVF